MDYFNGSDGTKRPYIEPYPSYLRALEIPDQDTSKKE